jgi:ATP-dependent Clp protease protease subunit
MKKLAKEFSKFALHNAGVSSLTQHHFKNAIEEMGVYAMTPNVIEERRMNAISISVFDRLMADRIIFLGLPIDDMVANVVNAQLLFLE